MAGRDEIEIFKCCELAAMKREQLKRGMPISASYYSTQNDETAQKDQSLIEVARRQRIQDDDPIMPLIVAWESSLEILRAQQKQLDGLYTKTQKEVTHALNQRIAFSEKEADRLKALAATLQVQMVCDIGTTIARESEKALTKRVKFIEARTVRALAATLLLSVIVTYSFGHWRGYNTGFAEKSRESEITLAKIRSTAAEAEKLFIDKPEELELWAPIIRLNPLFGTSILRTCYKKTLSSFGGFADQPGCWLPVRIPVPKDHPTDMTIPLPAPTGPPSSEEIW